MCGGQSTLVLSLHHVGPGDLSHPTWQQAPYAAYRFGTQSLGLYGVLSGGNWRSFGEEETRGTFKGRPIPCL